MLGIGHATNRGHCGNITLDNNMNDILNCPLINAFESDGWCNGMCSRLERTFSVSIESKTDYKTDISCFAIKLAALRCKDRVCYKCIVRVQHLALSKSSPASP